MNASITFSATEIADGTVKQIPGVAGKSIVPLSLNFAPSNTASALSSAPSSRAVRCFYGNFGKDFGADLSVFTLPIFANAPLSSFVRTSLSAASLYNVNESNERVSAAGAPFSLYFTAGTAFCEGDISLNLSYILI